MHRYDELREAIFGADRQIVNTLCTALILSELRSMSYSPEKNRVVLFNSGQAFIDNMIGFLTNRELMERGQEGNAAAC